ncbi:MAG: hypothetical protein KBD47_03245 [Candidatus Pacebacteria bacterium]|jgi:hypothetical protein|nr:hypothetical protein [Candidatus Paceibacterota bacterium]
MSTDFKSLVAIVFGVLSVFSRVLIDSIHITPTYLATTTIPLIISIFVLWTGVSIRKNGGKIGGLVAIVFGVIGVLGHALKLLLLVFGA